MTNQTSNAFVVNGAKTIALSQMFSPAIGSSPPTYLVLAALDRNEYTASASGATGSFSGDGNTALFTDDGGDGRAVGIVFQYNAATGQYYNSTYGNLSQLQYTASTSLGDVTNISLYATNDPNVAEWYSSDPYSMTQADPAGYLGSATVVTNPSFAGSVPSQATPNSIAITAESFIGQPWNINGCWVLASTIAAEAGASLPVTSTMLGTPGQANGEWIVAYNGPGGQTGNWESMVTAGEMILFENADGTSGHITTCVSGSGANAMLVDNIEYVNGSGQVLNPANDGSSSDISIAGPHAASQEWAGVQGDTVVIYELDTPIVADTVGSDTLAACASQSLGSLFSASDPGNRAIASYQVYDTWNGDSLVLNGTACAAHSAAAAISASSLSSVSLLAGTQDGSDQLEVRAFNGSYWGDWTALEVSVTGPATISTQPGQSTTVAIVGNTATVTTQGTTTKDYLSTGVTINTEGSDSISIDPTSALNVTVNGGAGRLTLTDSGTGSLNFNAGSGNLTLTGGAGTNTIALGSCAGGNIFFDGNMSVTSGTGPFNWEFTKGDAGNDVIPYKIGHDTIVLRGYGTDRSVAITSNTSSGGNTTLVLSDNTHITLTGVASMSNNSIVVQ
jgi:hypothetical protein